MGSSFAGIELGKRSLMAQTASINTAGHNISNADTEGYSRQRVNVSAYDPLYRPDLSRAERPGQVGQGIDIQSVERIRDNLLEQRIVAQTNHENYWTTREKYYSMIERIYNEPDGVSVRTTMDKFWEGWQELSLHPESQAARQAVVARGQTLVDAIHNEHTSLAGINTLLNGDIEATVSQINTFTSQIGELNAEIVRVKAMGDNPNDLLDRRDLLVEKLSGLINITTDNRDSDEFMIHTDGHVLVQGAITRDFAVEPTLDDTGYSKVVWADNGNDATFRGGTLASLIQLRDEDVRGLMQDLNTMTLNFSDAINDVHRNAIGANGVSGLDFFVQRPFVTNVNGNYDSTGDGQENATYIFRMNGANELNPKEQTGLAGTITLAGKEGNITVEYSSTDTVETIVKRINDADGEVKAYLDRDNRLVLKGTAAQERENPDFVIRHVSDTGYFLSGYAGLLSGQGEENAYTYTEANAIANATVEGTQYAVAPTANPAAYLEINPAIKSDVLSVAAGFVGENGLLNSGDGSAAVEIASVRNTAVMIGKNRTLDDYFANTVTQVGLMAEQSEQNMVSQEKLMADLRNMRDSISGVNINEELADIIKFQHGYNAAARFVSTVDELLDTVINRLKV